MKPYIFCSAFDRVRLFNTFFSIIQYTNIYLRCFQCACNDTCAKRTDAHVLTFQ